MKDASWILLYYLHTGITLMTTAVAPYQGVAKENTGTGKSILILMSNNQSNQLRNALQCYQYLTPLRVELNIQVHVLEYYKSTREILLGWAEKKTLFMQQHLFYIGILDRPTPGIGRYCDTELVALTDL